MLTGPVIHPPLLGALASAGHGSTVLLADANYPVSTASHPRASVVYLNLAPGLLDVGTVLAAIKQVLPIESATVMVPDGPEPEVLSEHARALPGVPLARLDRRAFYAAARSEDLAVVVATGEVRHWANLLLTVGVVPTADSSWTSPTKTPSRPLSAEGANDVHA